MARKSREGTTSNPRYVLKMYRNTGASTQSPQFAELAMTAAQAMGSERQLGLGAYKTARAETREVLQQQNVSSLLWGPYYAFCNEYVNKVQQRHSADAGSVIAKYTAGGLDGGVLQAIADNISAQATSTTQKPSKSK